MYGPHTKEDAIKHILKAQELEYDRIFIHETVRKRRELDQIYKESKSQSFKELSEELPSGFNWRKVMVAMIFDKDTKRVAYR